MPNLISSLPLFLSNLDSDDFFGEVDNEGGGEGVNEYGLGGKRLDAALEGCAGVNRLACRNVSKYGTLEVEPPYNGDSERELLLELAWVRFGLRDFCEEPELVQDLVLIESM